ncbi:glutamate-5-semialdehyde dehydrogenase [Streptococcus sp. DD12]|uniref:glutamate-5-semialdehyde dehydrogenase n=1 Tax=Streptococcus sp. DD12 TaxID=1777880 RepID=UPI0007959BBE|nr:glutamate-5-semialdehyde dehydrogenase [Streptococcus sp. DD12]KXT75929.1 Gamma-glutamyl phosphate reductase [Streptococcus sp. DD12]
MSETQEQFKRVQAVKRSINTASEEEKNQALLAIADALEAQVEDILVANAQDMALARGHISEVMLDRLYLDHERVISMAAGIRQVAQLPDPVGEILDETTLDNGLVLTKCRVAMGVVGIIYESRPNVTSDAAALALKSGNAVVLRTGKDAYQSAFAIVRAIQSALAQTAISPEVVQLLSDTSRESSYAMMRAKGYLDVLIPRGGAGLIQAVVENALVPVIETGTGIVHVYIDEQADLDKALAIVANAKTSRPSVCNAMEVLLVHEAVAEAFLPAIYQRLVSQRQAQGLEPVRLKCDAKAQAIIPGQLAGPDDFDTEFLDYVLAVKVVSSLQEAIDHIEQHSTHHSDAIVTEDKAHAAIFTRQVDSAAVYVNASTRFTDGGQFGLGCEMGISTQKLHARGPMGLKEMTTYKYIIQGNGQIRE